MRERRISKFSSSLPLNARLTENIYENLMMGDLKNEFQRTQGQISMLAGNITTNQDDISEIRNQNKRLLSYIQNYKKMISEIEKRKNIRHKYKSVDKSLAVNANSANVKSTFSGIRAESTVGGTSNSALELVRIEKLTNTLNMFSKIENLLDTFILCITRLK